MITFLTGVVLLLLGVALLLAVGVLLFITLQEWGAFLRGFSAKRDEYTYTTGAAWGTATRRACLAQGAASSCPCGGMALRTRADSDGLMHALPVGTPQHSGG